MKKVIKSVRDKCALFFIKKWSKSENRRWKKSAFDTSKVWISFLHRWEAERSASSKIYTFIGSICFLLAILGEILGGLTPFSVFVFFQNIRNMGAL